MEKVAERFIRYAKEYTTSDPESKTYPSTGRQLVFMKKLAYEILGLPKLFKELFSSKLSIKSSLLAIFALNDIELGKK
jgi:hypothetical protein